jgi:hypothetical protein
MVQFHTHTLPTATVAEAEAGLRDDVALSPASLMGALLPIVLPDMPESGSTITISDSPPAIAADGDMWWESDTGALWLWYVDPDGAQWVQVNGGGGGSGGGDDLDTTPVAAADSTLERVVPDWLAGAPVIEIANDVMLAPNHRGAWLHMMNDIGSIVQLADNWEPGMAVGVRQIGIGSVVWQTTGGATLQLSFSRSAHTGISEQYEECIFRVIDNVDGASAVWGVSGSTF